jgi:hypothetical protein
MITDFDNDGFRDLVITNGYPRDVNDYDFTTFRAQMSFYRKLELIWFFI